MTQAESGEKKRRLTPVVLPLAILAGAAILAWALVVTAPKPERRAPAQRGELVNVKVAERGRHRLDVHAQGTVQAARALEVRAQVSGRIEWVHPDLEPGGLLEQGDVLFRVEQREFRLRVREAKAELAQARSELALERARSKVARREWRLFHEEDADQADPTLALRKPQLLAAVVAVRAAEAQVERAELDLSRTTFAAPFDAVVESETAEVGQLVAPETLIAEILGSSRFWVEVAIPVDEVPLVAIPGINADTGAVAVIHYDVGAQTIEHKGRVARLLGTLNPQARMARVLVEVPDPLGAAALEKSQRRSIPLLVGAYVDVALLGRRDAVLTAVPPEAVRDGDRVYVVSEDDRLDVREVEVAWREPDVVLVSAGLSGGERVVVSHLAQPVEGMQLRVAAAPSAPQARLDSRDGRSHSR